MGILIKIMAIVNYDTLNEKSEKVEFVNNINGLIRYSFGKGFFGDWDSIGSVIWAGIGGYMKRGNELNIIAKRPWYADLVLGDGYIEAGEFIRKDGTELNISKKFLLNAELYAEFYESKFGNPVKINVVENYSNSL